MKVFLELLGVLFIVQAVGGLFSNLWGGSRSWFLVNYLSFLDGYEVFASIVIGVLGLTLCLAGAGKKKQS
ncbi:hypothetical protein [Sinosporangium siamense]|uniref:Uncharacterized protein n=1 Tax=Sinosporangium siamense TaxID=1367973 RepID=A0A919RA56_9ACTN|nr:hypothetical protein [Sinosporangium siamense]GII90201.1 hypothetical protein Ssi02_04320 [Sinosporangium siamense]